MTKTEKAIEKTVSQAFNTIGKNRQFNIMDLGKIMAAGKIAAANGQNVDLAVKEACDKYEIKG